MGCGKGLPNLDSRCGDAEVGIRSHFLHIHPGIRLALLWSLLSCYSGFTDAAPMAAADWKAGDFYRAGVSTAEPSKSKEQGKKCSSPNVLI